MTTGALALAVFMVIVSGLMGAYGHMIKPDELHVNPSITYDGVNVKIEQPAASYAVMVLLCLFIAVYAMSW